MAPQGWARLGQSRKFHYYAPDGRSLCGRYLALTEDPAAFEDTSHQHADNCAECQRRKLKQLGERL